MSKQRTHKFVTKILRKTCSSLVKLFLENNFSQNKSNRVANRSSNTLKIIINAVFLDVLYPMKQFTLVSKSGKN